MNFARRMKLLRKTKGYTQKDFAKLLKIGYSTYQQYEMETVEPKNKFTQRLCKTFPEYTLWLMTGDLEELRQIDPYLQEEQDQTA